MQTIRDGHSVADPTAPYSVDGDAPTDPAAPIEDLIRPPLSADDVEGGSPGGGGSDAITDPTDIAGCALWLDASTLALADGDPVATWPDGSGNGYDATQGTALNRPVCKTNVLNGLRVVRFDPSDDPQWMTFSGAALSMFSSLDGITIVATSRLDATGTGYVLVGCTAPDPGPYPRVEFTLGTSDASLRVSYADGSDPTELLGYAATLTIPASTARSIVWVVDAVNAVLDATGVPASDQFSGLTITGPGSFAATPLDRLTLGDFGGDGSQAFGSDIAELVVYQRALSQRERRQLAEYLSTKWGTL